MSFWDEHEKAEAAHAKAEAAKAPPPKPTSQNAPARCRSCGQEDKSVLLGICDYCFLVGSGGPA